MAKRRIISGKIWKELKKKPNGNQDRKAQKLKGTKMCTSWTGLITDWTQQRKGLMSLKVMQ